MHGTRPDGGFLDASSTPSAWATFRFSGSNVAWVASRGANRGQANLYLDGTFQTTIDLYSPSTAARSLVAVGNTIGSGIHTLKVEVVGTSGRPTVDVDSFVVLY